MTAPIVETFEHDIADEIRHKEASITDIVTAVGDIGNNEEVKKNNMPLIVSVSVLAIFGLIGSCIVGYMYYTGAISPTTKNTSPLQPSQQVTKKSSSLTTISPTLEQAIGNFLSNPQKTKDGYSVTITSYSPVFAYMIKNEQAYGDDLGLAVGNGHTIKRNDQATTTQAITSTSSIATSSQATSTNSQASGGDQELTTSYVFSDITISNQNMRIGNSVYGTVVYAFIGTNHLVISSSTSGILALRSSVLQK